MIYTILLALAGLGVWIWFIVKEEYDRTIVVVIGAFLFLVWLGLSYIPVSLIGFHYETSQGEHFGYITAVQKQGVFFKTGRAYVKTDNQSSQEDAYCVMDEKVYQQLQDFAQSKERVEIKYLGYFSAGVKNCGGEGDIIYEVLKVEP